LTGKCGSNGRGMEGGTSLKKIIAVGGDGGMIATNNERIAES